jgi:hypothetical protein
VGTVIAVGALDGLFTVNKPLRHKGGRPKGSKKPAPRPKITDPHQDKIIAMSDLVEDIHRILVNDDAKYRGYLRATYDQHAITGSLSFAADLTIAM